MRIDSTKPQAAGQAALEQRLRQACQDFEAVFLRHLLQKMREAVPEGGLLGQTRGEELFRSMLDGALADEMAKSGSLGLGRMLWEQLSRVAPSESPRDPSPLGPAGSGGEDTQGLALGVNLKTDGDSAEDGSG